jgi:hypothetical protein
MYAGVTFHLALEDRVRGVITRTGTFTASATSGFMVFWPAAFDREAFGMALHVYGDVNADGACSSTDPTWDETIDNDFMTGHPLVFNLMLGSSAGMSFGSCAAFP